MTAGRKTIGWSLLCGLTALVAALGGCGSKPQEHLKGARDALFEKKPEEALREYRLALEELAKDDSAEAQVYRARALRGIADTYYLEQRDLRRAVEAYKELAARCPEAPETLEGRLHLADLLHDHYRNPRAAISELTAAIARNPPQAAELTYRVAKYYFELRDYNQVDLEVKGLLERYEASPYVDDALLLRGQALAMIGGRHAEAARAFQQLLDNFADSPLSPHALFELGKLREEAGDGEAAIELWVRALERHPDPEVLQTVIARTRARLVATTPKRIGDQASAFDHKMAAPRPAKASPKAATAPAATEPAATAPASAPEPPPEAETVATPESP